MTTATPKVFTATSAQNTGQFTPADWGLFSGVSLVWGASFLFIAIGLEALAPGMVTLLRVGGGALTLTVISGLQGGFTKRPDRADLPRILLLAVIWVAVPFTLFPLAQEHVNSAVTGLLNGATPIFATLVAVAVFGQRTRGAQLVGLVIGFTGIVLMSAPSLNEGSSEALGVAMILFATLCYGFALNIAPPLQQKYGSVTLMGWVLAAAAVLNIPFGLWDLPNSRFEWGPLLAVLVLAVVGTGIAFALMAQLVGRVGGPRASFITYVIPVVALGLGVVFRDDTVSPMALGGVVLVLAGAYLASRKSV